MACDPFDSCSHISYLETCSVINGRLKDVGVGNSLVKNNVNQEKTWSKFSLINFNKLLKMSVNHISKRPLFEIKRVVYYSDKFMHGIVLY